MTSSISNKKEPISFSVIDAIVYKQNRQPGAMISILQEIQEVCSYVPREAILRVSEITHVPASEIYGIVTFYAQFRLQPQGRHIIKICHGTACHLNGAEKLSDEVCRCVGAKEGETSPDGQFSVEKVACLGCCSLAPTIMIDNETFGRLTPDNVVATIEGIASAKSTLSPE
jgi:NADH-quinone oxidoreductase subunit E